VADTRELHESQIVSEGQDIQGQDIQGQDLEGQNAGESADAPAASEAQDAAALRKPRPKRASVKSVENRVAAIEQRVETFAQELAQLSRMAEQLAHLGGRIAKLEENLQARASNDTGVQYSAGITDQVRQLDERLQKLANVLAQQAWSRV
jgi:predicted RNase H-like nuclease (RuvC/YqgF family)